MLHLVRPEGKCVNFANLTLALKLIDCLAGFTDRWIFLQFTSKGHGFFLHRSDIQLSFAKFQESNIFAK